MSEIKWKCPYCSPASFVDLKKYDPEVYEEWKLEAISDGVSEKTLLDEDNAPTPEGFGCPWVVVYFEEALC